MAAAAAQAVQAMHACCSSSICAGLHGAAAAVLAWALRAAGSGGRAQAHATTTGALRCVPCSLDRQAAPYQAGRQRSNQQVAPGQDRRAHSSNVCRQEGSYEAFQR